jgi:hypothetical protein
VIITFFYRPAWRIDATCPAIATVVCRGAPGFCGMKSSTRPRPFPPAGDTFTAFTFDGTAVHVEKHPNGNVVTSTKYTPPWIGTISDAKYCTNGVPSLGDGADRNVMLVESVQMELGDGTGEPAQAAPHTATVTRIARRISRIRNGQKDARTDPVAQVSEMSSIAA